MSEKIFNVLKDFRGTLTTEETYFVDTLLASLAEDKIAELASLSPEAILSEEEVKIYKDIVSQTETPKTAMSPSMVLVMKSTRLCNLRCTYCHSWKKGPNQVMTFRVLAKTTADTLANPSLKNVEFVWHGGETTLLPSSYYLKAVWLQEQFRSEHQRVTNAIQTNGTLLNDDWVNFLKDYRFQVGISLDGPDEINDLRRVDKAKKPTSPLVKASIARLIETKVPFGVLMVLDNEVMALPSSSLLDYFVQCGVQSLAILNAIPENVSKDSPISGTYLEWNNYILYMKKLFSVWWNDYRAKIKIREFHFLMNNIQKTKGSNICIFAGDCMGKYITIEPEGNVNACDKYIGDPGFFFGTIMNDNLTNLLNVSGKLLEARKDHHRIKEKMRDCDWFYACQGGCPHDYRLSSLYDSSFNGTCCGLFSLIEHINSYTKDVNVKELKYS